MPWPPKDSNLTKDNVKIEDSFESFLKIVLSGGVARLKADKVQKLKISIWHDIVSAVSPARVRTPKSILFPYTI